MGSPSVPARRSTRRAARNAATRIAEQLAPQRRSTHLASLSDNGNGEEATSGGPTVVAATTVAGGWSLDSAGLRRRKRQLKQQLRLYDMIFHAQHGRMPEKREKEPIRHLYERYNAYKNLISVIERGEDEEADGPPSEVDMSSLRAEKATLHQTLRSYEKDFYRQHNRQVSSFADIRPVASQYRRYYKIKRAIAHCSSLSN